jgi:hypothetical protein
MNTSTSLHQQESAYNQSHYSSSTTLFCWKSIIAGIFVSVLSYMIFSALGAGIGGFTVAHVIAKNENGPGLAAGAGLWLGFSSVISLFLGSYFATRYSDATHKQIGAAQGIVISAVFFFLVLQSSGNVLGNLSAFSVNLSGSISGISDPEEAARIVGDTGWIMFSTFVVGVIAAIVGGCEGALGNRKRPFSRLQ